MGEGEQLLKTLVKNIIWDADLGVPIVELTSIGKTVLRYVALLSRKTVAPS